MLISITRLPFAPLTTGSSNIIYPLDQIVVCPSLCNTSREIRMGAAQEPPLSQMRAYVRRSVFGMRPCVPCFADSTIIFYGYCTLGPTVGGELDGIHFVIFVDHSFSGEEVWGLIPGAASPRTCFAAKRNADPGLRNCDAVRPSGVLLRPRAL
jgi:hypothetical protein